MYNNNFQNFSQASFGGPPGGMDANSANMGNLPTGYSQQPASQSSITIDDIIGALQNSKIEKAQALQKASSLENLKQQPLDLNNAPIYYMVVSDMFAGGKVIQPLTTMLRDIRTAKFELDKLKRQNPAAKYRIFKVVLSEETISEPEVNKTYPSMNHPSSQGITSQLPEDDSDLTETDSEDEEETTAQNPPKTPYRMPYRTA